MTTLEERQRVALIESTSELQTYVQHMRDCSAVVEGKGCTCGLVDAVDRARTARCMAPAYT
jgi:hypothetical protein